MSDRVERGPQGDTGPAGAPGAQGARGARGSRGPRRIPVPGVLEFALAALLVSVLVAGVAVAFGFTNRVTLDEVQEGRRVGTASICAVEKALIEEGASVIIQAGGSANDAAAYRQGVVRRALQEADLLGVELPSLRADGTFDCQKFAVATKTD
jgi:hypothetical protein